MIPFLGKIVLGVILGTISIGLVYCVLSRWLNPIFKKFFNKVRNIQVTEPTVCEKLGDVQIYPKQYKNVQSIRKNFLEEKERVCTLIEFIFPKPQATYNKFYYDVVRLNNAFDKQYKSLHIYVRAYPIEDETSYDVIVKGLHNLEDFYLALQNLTKELSQLTVCNRSTDNLMDDMKREQNDVKNYQGLHDE